MRRAVGAALLVFLAGCFSYVPVDPDTAPVGEDVRVRLRPEAAEELSGVVPVDDLALQGTLLRREQGRWMLRVPSTARSPDFRAETFRQDVWIEADDVSQAEGRKFDWGETALVAAGGAVVVGALLGVIVGDPVPGGPNDPPGPEQFSFPLFSLPAP